MMHRIPCLIPLLVAVAFAQHEPAKGINFYSFEKEVALGRQLADDFQRSFPPLNSPQAVAYIDDLGRRLAAQMGGPPFQYTFALVADDPAAMHEIAAFPGGFLFVPSTLILEVQDEDELAGMLAHAIAHVASRDGTRQATRAELIDTASIPVIYMGGWTGYAMRQAQSVAIPLGMLQTWRKFELAADVLAAHKMAAAGYDPEALAHYIERVQWDDGVQPKMWSALPPKSQRVTAIRAAIAEIGPQQYGPHEGLAQAQEELRRLTAKPPRPAPSLRK